MRRMESVGPKVSGELLRSGLYAVVLALVAMLLYIWVRFEWRYGLARCAHFFTIVWLCSGSIRLGALSLTRRPLWPF